MINSLIDMNFTALLKEDKCVSKKDYLHAVNVWNMFKMKTMSIYHYLYLKTDALLLANCLWKFIGVCLEFHWLDPCHCLSSLWLSWNAMLKISAVELELISDIDMNLIVEKGMRGGTSYITKRYSKSNYK